MDSTTFADVMRGLCTDWRRRVTWTLTCGVLLGTFGQVAQAQQSCEATDHGMHADGSDNTAALTRTLSECAGRSIHVASGSYVFSPSGFAPGLRMPPDTSLVGDGSQGDQQTVFQIASTGNFQALLWVRNVSNVAIRGIHFEGGSYESGCARHLDYGHAIYVQSDAGESRGVDGVEISGNAFHDFNGQSWITVNAADGSPGVGLNSAVAIRNNVFDSDADLRGGCAGSGGISYPVMMVWLHGSDDSAQGLVANATVESNTFNAAYVKGAVVSWSGTRSISIEHNLIRDAGLRLPPAPGTELGRYAILVYQSSHERPGLPPDNVRVASNVITNAVSCGIYVAGGRNIEIIANRISGQSDRWDATLPKGAISLNHVKNVSALQDNELANNYIGISSVGSEINMGSNNISAPPGGAREKIR